LKVDIQDVLFWMDAIRNSDDRYRTLESFWKGQVNSKIWLIENLQKFQDQKWEHIVIHGGWNGVLASLIFNSGIEVDRITSVDIDPGCEETAYTINKRYEMTGRFRAVTADMCKYSEPADVIINTSCEHITQPQYYDWLHNQNDDSLYVLQSNNYFDLNEHINCSEDLVQFVQKSKLRVVFSDRLQLPKYDRYMIIGKKNDR